MANNIVAYIGVDNYDHLIYFAKILANLGNKVLIIDHSDTGSMKSSTPLPEGIEFDKEIITYRGVDFTAAEITQEIIEVYDDILISYCFQEDLKEIHRCNRYIFVTDLHRYNLERLIKIIKRYRLKEEFNNELLVRDVIDSKISPDMLAEQLNHNFNLKNLSVLYLDGKDYANSLVCHYNGDFSFRHISGQLKKYLIKEVKSFYPELNHKQVYTAYLHARRGD